VKRTIKIDLPERNALAAAIAVAVDPKFAADLAAAERRLREGRDYQVACGRDIEQLRVAVARGAATYAALEAALNRATAAQLVIEAAERDVALASSASLDAAQAVKHQTYQRACRRRDELQAIADQIAPVLDELRDLERELDYHARAAVDKEVPPLSWPQSLVDEGGFVVRPAAAPRGVVAQVTDALKTIVGRS
jgi:chromosome segregation ATPase